MEISKNQDKRKIRKERTREAIKAAALDIARHEGWSGVTIRKIADHIDYTAPIVYEHFKNKDDLYHHLVQDGFTLLREKSLEESNRISDPEKKLVALARVRFEFALEYPTLHHMMFDTSNPEWQKIELAKSMLAIKELIEQVVTEISGQPDKVMEYSFNVICHIKGYTFFANHLLNTTTSMTRHFPADKEKLTHLFISATERFITSIRKK